MKRFSYLLLLALLFLGLVGPVIYTHRTQTQEPAGQSRAAVREGTSGTPGSKESEAGSANSRSQAGLPSNAAPGKTSSQEPQSKQNPPEPSKETPAAQTPAASKEITVISIAVIGQDGRLLYGPAQVKLTRENPWGTTALAALDATGLPYTISARFTGFVDSIAGQRNRGQAGWMYSVNGELPSVAASQKPVKQGNRVLWWYSQSMDQTPPSWDELAKHR